MKISDFDPSAPLPIGLDVAAIRKSIPYIERELADLVDVYVEQANVFSALVGIFATRALDQNSAYEKHRHSDRAQQRFPDLKLRGSGDNPRPEHCLECKASKRIWAIQSHYDHPGWYIVWRYLVDKTESFEAGRPLIIWRVDVIFLERKDWKYEKSSAGEGRGGRTHTFGVRKPESLLKGKAVYRRSDVRIVRQKPVPANGNDGTVAQ